MIIGVCIIVEKNLLYGVGIGGGLVDVVVMLNLLVEFWGVEFLVVDDFWVFVFGVDVFVCFKVFVFMCMEGIGEVLIFLKRLLNVGLIFVNFGIYVLIL